MMTPYPKDRLLSDAAREALGRGQGSAVYRLTTPDYDRVPDRTFLVRSVIGTGGRVWSVRDYNNGMKRVRELSNLGMALHDLGPRT